MRARGLPDTHSCGEQVGAAQVLPPAAHSLLDVGGLGVSKLGMDFWDPSSSACGCS